MNNYDLWSSQGEQISMRLGKPTIDLNTIWQVGGRRDSVITSQSEAYFCSHLWDRAGQMVPNEKCVISELYLHRLRHLFLTSQICTRAKIYLFPMMPLS